MVRGLKIIRGKFALRLCGVQAVFFTCVTAEKHVQGD